ncbi:MAG TPA: DUF2007 domain-containing protein [Phototrophicaceae bacterium]|nr:DUF2007 domain-containing protein [Phototrophicaceae bacterium]
MSQKSLGHLKGWVVVYIAQSEPDAYIVAGRLQTEGIKTFIHQEPAGRAYGLTVGMLGEITVLVLPEDFDRAMAILDDADYESDDTDIVADDYTDANNDSVDE